MGTLSFDAASGGGTATVDSNVTIQTLTMTGYTSTSTTGALNLMSGTTAQRPTLPLTGYLRFNTTLSVVEFYNGTIWVTL